MSRVPAIVPGELGSGSGSAASGAGGRAANRDGAEAVAGQVRAAVAAARAAQAGWALVGVRQRLKLIRRVRHLLVEDSLVLGRAAGGPRARPLAETVSAEVLPLADACRFLERRACGLLAARRAGGRGRPGWLRQVALEIRREPLGVILKIAPFNYPLLIPGVVALQALAAGNAVLIKPGTRGTPAAEAFAALAHAAGLDRRLCVVLPETPVAAQEAIAAGVDKVFLTGSAGTGRVVQALAAGQLVPTTMELSGCDAVVVRKDADVEMAAGGLAFGLRLNAGATCLAPRRVLVHASRAPELEGRLVKQLQAEPPVEVEGEAGERLRGAVVEALAQGARLVHGSVAADQPVTGPLVIASASPAMRVAAEDFFAPVLALIEISGDAEALALANASAYGLGASIFTRDVRAGEALAGGLQAGVVVINDLIVPTADPRLAFGGRKRSGFGVTRGAEGLLEMTAVKAVVRRGGRWRPHFAATDAGDEALFADYLTAAHGRGFFNRARAGLRLLGGLSRKARGIRRAVRTDGSGS